MFDQGSGGGTAEDKQALMQTVSGVKFFFWKERWKNIETAEGVIDYALIDSFLDALPTDTYLILGIREQLFTDTYQTNAHGMFPAYMDGVGSGPYFRDSGATWPGSLAVNLNDDETAGMDRKIWLYSELIGHYNLDPRLYLICTGETSVGVPAGFGYSSSAHVTEYERFAAAIGAIANRKTRVKVTTNYCAGDDASKSRMERIVQACEANQIDVGGPDVMPAADREFDDTEVWLGNTGTDPQDYRGRIPRVCSVDYTEFGGYLGSYTPAQLYEDAAYGQANVQAAIWLWFWQLSGSPGSITANRWPAVETYILAHPISGIVDPYTGSGDVTDPGGPGPITKIGLGSVVEADNAAITTAFGATSVNNDTVLTFGALRTGTAGRTISVPGDYTTIATFGASSQQPMILAAKTVAAAASSPVLTPLNGVATNVLQGVGELLRNLRQDAATLVHAGANKSTTGAFSGVPITTPALVVTEDDCLLRLYVSYQDDCTDMGTFNPGAAGAWTRIVFAPTTTGLDQTIAVYELQQSTATNVAAGTIAITGGSAALARVMLVALRGV